MTAVVALVATGCQETRIEQSSVLYESATILSAVHTPSHHKLGVKATTADKEDLVGIDFGGNLGLNLGNGMQVSAVEVPEKFAVVFDCEHGQFIVQRKELYDKLKGVVGKRVVVSYKENYRVTYDKDDTGKKVETSRVLIGYDFINASVVEKAEK